MCIAEKKAAYVAPGARAALAQAAPTPAFAVVAPPKRFDAEANDARCVPRRPTPSHRQTRRASSPRARAPNHVGRSRASLEARRRAVARSTSVPRARLRLSDDGSHAAFPRKTRSPRETRRRPRLTLPTLPSPSRPPGSPPTPSSRSPPAPAHVLRAGRRPPRRLRPSHHPPGGGARLPHPRVRLRACLRRRAPRALRRHRPGRHPPPRQRPPHHPR